MTPTLQNNIEEAVRNAVWHKKSALGKDEPVMTYADAMRMAASIYTLAQEEARKEMVQKLEFALSSAGNAAKYPLNNPYIHLKDHIYSIINYLSNNTLQ